MERPVKERLIGAAVLMAAAVILIPEMLSGPERKAQVVEVESAGAPGQVPIKTYTIDLSQSPGAQITAETIDNRAPPPEQVSPSPPQQPAREDPARAQAPRQEPSAATAMSPRNSALPQAGAPRASVIERPTQAPTLPPAPQRELASRPNAPISAGWAVQVGSFSKEASAERLAKQLRAQGQEAFVMPVKSGATTFYRVRIGPMKDRASAEAVLSAAKAVAPGAAVVTHP